MADIKNMFHIVDIKINLVHHETTRLYFRTQIFEDIFVSDHYLI